MLNLLLFLSKAFSTEPNEQTRTNTNNGQPVVSTIPNPSKESDVNDEDLFKQSLKTCKEEESKTELTIAEYYFGEEHKKKFFKHRLIFAGKEEEKNKDEVSNFTLKLGASNKEKNKTKLKRQESLKPYGLPILCVTESPVRATIINSNNVPDTKDLQEESQTEELENNIDVINLGEAQEDFENSSTEHDREISEIIVDLPKISLDDYKKTTDESDKSEPIAEKQEEIEKDEILENVENSQIETNRSGMEPCLSDPLTQVPDVSSKCSDVSIQTELEDIDENPVSVEEHTKTESELNSSILKIYDGKENFDTKSEIVPDNTINEIAGTSSVLNEQTDCKCNLSSNTSNENKTTDVKNNITEATQVKNLVAQNDSSSDSDEKDSSNKKDEQQPKSKKKITGRKSNVSKSKRKKPSFFQKIKKLFRRKNKK